MQICDNLSGAARQLPWKGSLWAGFYLCVPTKKMEMTPGPVWAPMTGPT